MTSAAKPAVSVLIPLYNKANFIETCVRSVLAQDCPDFELVIVDDGSTDDSVARVQAGFDDPRIRIMRQANGGVGAARNRAIREARTNLLAFLDADDEWLPTHLSDLLYLAREFPQAGLLCTRVHAVLDGQMLSAEHPVREPSLIPNYFEEIVKPIPWTQPSCCAVPRRVVERIGGFLEGTPYGEDQEYWIRISLYYPMAFYPRPSTIYRLGVPGSAITAGRWDKRVPPVETMKQFLKDNGGWSRRLDILNCAAWFLMNHAANGMKVGALNEARALLSDPILDACRFQRRVRTLRLAASIPVPISRALYRVHAMPWLKRWRDLYTRIMGTQSMPHSAAVPELVSRTGSGR